MFKRKKKKEIPTGRITALKVNSVDCKIINLRIFNDAEGVPRLTIFTQKPQEAMHYEESEFVIDTLESRRIRLTARFDSAEQSGRLYKYSFIIEKYNEVFA